MGPVNAIDNQLVRAHFSAHAGDYDRYAAVQKRVVAHLVAQLHAAGLPAAGALLDIGTGTGALADALGGATPQRPLVLFDLAHGMTRTAASRLPGSLACDGDARHLPFRDGSFNTVVSSSVYQWLDDLPAAFAEVARVLRPGGLFGVALFGERTLIELRTAHRQAVMECAAAHRSHVQSFPAAAEVATALQRAGLLCREFISFPELDWHPDVPTLLRQLKQIGAGNAAADRPKGLASRRIMQRMLEIYEAGHRQWQGIPATYEVVCAVAVRP
jgi:malonyl-CoA O-methyltransferase